MLASESLRKAYKCKLEDVSSTPSPPTEMLLHSHLSLLMPSTLFVRGLPLAFHGSSMELFGMKACINSSGKLMCLWQNAKYHVAHEGHHAIQIWLEFTIWPIWLFIFFYYRAPWLSSSTKELHGSSPSTKELHGSFPSTKEFHGSSSSTIELHAYLLLLKSSKVISFY